MQRVNWGRIGLLMAVLTAAVGLVRAEPAGESPAEPPPRVAHNVYFSLKDASPAARDKLVNDCHTYLADIPGIVFYAAGVVSDIDRPVNDRDFDVALHTVFENEAALHAYLVHPEHDEFVERNRPNWARVRVFDSDVRGKP